MFDWSPSSDDTVPNPYEISFFNVSIQIYHETKLFFFFNKNKKREKQERE